jgi:tetratricopeptide (TPR) repeat protein
LFAACRLIRVRRFIDLLLLAFLVVIAFLLGCYEMGDSDIWWHLKGGEWILENGRVPDLDPFTFGSADKRWIDIHWSYEVILALTYRAGGVGALILLAAAVGALAFALCLKARRREWSVFAAVLCWMPALVLLAFRLDPRPEIFTLLYLACFLAVLGRAEERPTLLWLLPLVQILWVNVQGLFILGPILVGLFVAAHGAQAIWLRLRERAWPTEQLPWLHLGGASVSVVAACLVNPYFLDGARFPFDLFPKVAEAGNPYKQYIDELMSPRDYVMDSTPSIAGRNWFFLSFYFLLLLLPLSFILPALWRAWRGVARPESGEPGSSALGSSIRELTHPARQTQGVPRNLPSSHGLVWIGGLATAVLLLMVRLLTLSPKTPPWLILLGDQVWLIFLLGGAALAILMRKRSSAAVLFALLAGAGMGSWIQWLQSDLLLSASSVPGSIASSPLAIPLLLLSAAAGFLVLRWEGSLFRIFLALAFAYLSLQALQNWSRFALVAGTVLAWNFGEWARELAAGWKPTRVTQGFGWTMRAALLTTLGMWISALIGDRFYTHTGEPRHFAFREQPLEFAHEAALFAGQPGLPERALVYGLGQTGVYVFHNAPRCKPFMDGRLEMPDRETFETYVAIENGLRRKDTSWEKAVAALGNPLLLLEHQGNFSSEALLLTHPNWECVYHDALASIFIHRDDKTYGGQFPAVSFAARHFTRPLAPPVPEVRGAAAREEKALFNLAASLPRSPEVTWQWRIPALWLALDRAGLAIDEEPARPDVWVLMGNCYWNLNPDLSSRPLSPAEEWNLERGVYWAQATYCSRRAAEMQPDHGPAWRYLYESYRARQMVDAHVDAGEHWLSTDPKIPASAREQVASLRQALQTAARQESFTRAGARALVEHLLQSNRPAAAIAVLENTDLPQVLDWKFAERVAGIYMHLGRPADARRIWAAARECPSPATRLARLGSTYWLERDFVSALRYFQEARGADPHLTEASWGLAFLHAELGNLKEALASCREGLQASPNARQRSDLEALQHLLLSLGM